MGSSERAARIRLTVAATAASSLKAGITILSSTGQEAGAISSDRGEIVSATLCISSPSPEMATYPLPQTYAAISTYSVLREPVRNTLSRLRMLIGPENRVHRTQPIVCAGFQWCRTFRTRFEGQRHAGHVFKE